MTKRSVACDGVLVFYDVQQFYSARFDDCGWEGTYQKSAKTINGTWAGIRETFSDDWGERKQFGAVYMIEVIQANKHLAVGEMTVTYENVSVTYRLTYDEDMHFAGIYVR